MSHVLTAHTGNNAQVFPSVLRLYVPDGSDVLDMTFGRGVFWKEVPWGLYKLRTNDLATRADTQADFRTMPYADGAFDAVILDPPYMHSGGSIKRSLDSCYRNGERGGSWRDILPMYLAGSAEAWRLLRVGGVLILKVQDTVVNHRQFFLHAELLSVPGFDCEDLFVLVQPGKPLMSSRWKRQYHARKNHSYFIVLRKRGERT